MNTDGISISDEALKIVREVRACSGEDIWAAPVVQNLINHRYSLKEKLSGVENKLGELITRHNTALEEVQLLTGGLNVAAQERDAALAELADEKLLVKGLEGNLKACEQMNEELRAELETAKAGRNKAALQERKKYIPQIIELRAELTQTGMALDGYIKALQHGLLCFNSSKDNWDFFFDGQKALSQPLVQQLLSKEKAKASIP